MAELSTVATVQSYLGDPNADAGLIATMLAAAESRIARMCGRYDVAGNHWLSASHTEYIDGDMAQHVLLRWTPISAVSSVSITTSATSSQAISLLALELDGIAIANLSATTPGTFGRLGWRVASNTYAQWFDYGYPQPNWIWSVGYPNWSDGRQRVTVAYTGGFASAPSDLTLAATILTAAMYREKSRDPAITSQTLGDFSQSFGESQAGRATLGSISDLISPHLRMTA